MSNLEQKMYYTICGSMLGLANIYLIDTRFNLVGVGFGVVGALLLIKAILIRK